MGYPCRMRTDVVRARLRDMCLSQTELARQSAVELRTLQRWLAGQGVPIEGAEAVAATLGLGTRDCFDGIPDSHYAPPLARLRRWLRWLPGSQGDLGIGLRAIADHFDFITDGISFVPHPAHGFVVRQPIDRDRVHAFSVLRIASSAEQGQMTFWGQTSGRLRYLFGRLMLDAERITLDEHFHMRRVCAPRREDGSFDIWVWSPPDMRCAVLVSDVPVERTAFDMAPTPQLFAADAEHSRHAVCFRPSVMGLRAAGLPAHFDRVTGERWHTDQGAPA